jgi:hypothetical protein
MHDLYINGQRITVDQRLESLQKELDNIEYAVGQNSGIVDRATARRWDELNDEAEKILQEIDDGD